jgi:serine/threonine protein kinase/tetratricopeptide (TPR) repeat protein
VFSPGAVFDYYRIEELIGTGSMGAVYRATDLNSGDIVALKMISDSLSQSETYQVRLAREAAAASKIDSPYVVKVRRHAVHEDHHYLAMEYVAGKDLRESIKDNGFDRKINLIRQIAQGLKAAHEQRLLHLDLKPENIKVTEDDRVKILDFGLAKTVSADSVDRFGNIEGTLYYIAPEQLTNEVLSFATDLFSFGVILYEIFTGRRPFDGEYPAAIIYSILHEEPEPPSRVNSGLPLWLNDLVMKMLSKKLLDRYNSVTDVLGQIESGLKSDAEPLPLKIARTRQTVTVVELNNLSDDAGWDYFCSGFTDDLINELSRRTNLIISAQPSSTFRRNVKEIFIQCRSDFVIVGSLLKWQDRIRLNLTIYGERGDGIVFGNKYEAEAGSILEVLSCAVRDSASKLEEATGLSSIEVEELFKTDIAAYDYYLKGKSYYQTNKPDDLKIAERMFRKALEVDPNLAYAHSGLSDIYAFQYMAYYDRSQEKLEMARQEAERAIAISPELPEAHRSLGRYYMFAGNYAEAEKSFVRSVNYNPKYAIGYRTLGWLKYMSGENDQAREWARLSLKYAPTDVETLLLLGLINRDKRRFTVAMATLHRALELAPDYGRAYFNLGTVYLKLGVLDVALENFFYAAKYKGDPSAEMLTGYVLLLQNRNEDAKFHFRQSLEAGYFPFIAFYMLGLAEKLAGNAEIGQDYYNKAISVACECHAKDRSDPYCQAYLALALASTGRNEEALHLLDNLEASVTDNGEVMHDIARGFAILGYYDRAREILSRAITIYAGPSEKEILLDPHFKNIPLYFQTAGTNKNH